MKKIAIENLRALFELLTDMFGSISETLAADPKTWLGVNGWAYFETGYAVMSGFSITLLIIFFYVGLTRDGLNFFELRANPEKVFSRFLWLAVSAGLVKYSLDIFLLIYDEGRNLILGLGSEKVEAIYMLTDQATETINKTKTSVAALYAVVTLLLFSFAVFIKFYVQFLLYSRMFRVFFYLFMSSIGISMLAGEPTRGMGAHYIKSFVVFLIEAILIVFACNLFSYITVGQSDQLTDASLGGLMLFAGQIFLNICILVGLIKGMDRVAERMFGV